ncbi:Divalent Anion:Na+ Symporter [Blattamonas nauphoetae]|uniref:Divalent Anion:Na+ Symporter n=1 Tax=Blattamonas nauphoetae TaxID=2049346 RepID=A0ABQ9WX46_9EUKA|nr:Divalent Anion:Na+ Symporter [Blattamonas nauphoetae]
MKYKAQFKRLRVERWGTEYLQYHELESSLHRVFHKYQPTDIHPAQAHDPIEPAKSLSRAQSKFQLDDARQLLHDRRQLENEQGIESTQPLSPSTDHQPTKPVLPNRTSRRTGKPPAQDGAETKAMFSIQAGDSSSADSVSIRPRPSNRRRFFSGEPSVSDGTADITAFSSLSHDGQLSVVVPQWISLFQAELDRVTQFVDQEMAKQQELYNSLSKAIKSAHVNQTAVLELKRRFLELSTDLSELSSFITVNQRGFAKLITKINHYVQSLTIPDSDKTSLKGEITKLQQETVSVFDQLTKPGPFIESLHTLFVDTFSVGRLAGNGTVEKRVELSAMTDPQFEKYQLSLLEEIQDSTEAQLAWRRNTIASQIARFRGKAQVPEGINVSDGDHGVHLQKEEEGKTDVVARVGIDQKPKVKFYFKVKYHAMVIAFAVLLIFALLPWPEDYARQMRCLGMLVWACVMWGMDAAPSHVTAICIPFLACLLQLGRKKGLAWSEQLITATISNTPYLAIGGFSIALAMKNSGLDQKLSAAILSFKFVRRPRIFVLVAILMEVVLTMFISSVSSTVLVVSFILPVIRELPPNSTFIKALLMSIAMAGNAGGMTTPLASPQSLVGMGEITKILGERTTLNFGKWTISAFPHALTTIGVTYFLLFCFFPVDIPTVPCPPTKLTCLTFKQAYVTVVSLITIVFWFILPYCPFLGSEAIISLIPFVAFFGFNCVQKPGISELPWPMIMLVLGGGALGECVKESTLLDLITQIIGGFIQKVPFYVQLVILCGVCSFVSIFISHTVAALVLIPIVGSLVGGEAKHAELILMACTMCMSPIMILPVASFPNMCTAAVEDADHKPYLKSGDFGKFGGTVTIVSFLSVISVFYGWGLVMKL